MKLLRNAIGLSTQIDLWHGLNGRVWIHMKFMNGPNWPVVNIQVSDYGTWIALWLKDKR